MLRQPAKHPASQTSSAGFVTRAVAIGVDATIVAVGLLSNNLLWQALLGSRGVRWIEEGAARALPPLGPALAALGQLIPVVLGIAIGCGYFLFFFCITGQTVGKRIMGLVVVDRSGRRLTVRRAALRLCGYVISALPMYLGFLAVLTDADRLAWHDRLAGTRVIYVQQREPRKRR